MTLNTADWSTIGWERGWAGDGVWAGGEGPGAGTGFGGGTIIKTTTPMSFKVIAGQISRVGVFGRTITGELPPVDLALSNPISASLGTPEVATLTIRDDEGAFYLYLPLILRD